MTKLKHDQLVIPKDGSDPFVNCQLGRKEFAKMLTNIIKNHADGFVMSIENEWGAGKTTFIKMWKQYLENEPQDFKTLYFNAWENDFQDEIMIAFLSQLQNLQTAETKFENVLQKSGKFFAKIMPAVAKGVATKLGGEEAVAEIISAATEFTADEVATYINVYEEKKKDINSFKALLTDYVGDLDDKPIVFFIDELDRCKPDYAVKVLEQIKHFFSVRGIIFVLSIDKSQLESAIKGYYGSDEIDAKKYLKRFIDIGFSLPKPEFKLFLNYLVDYYQFDDFFKHVDRIDIPEFRDDSSTFRDYLSIFFHADQFDLRTVEKIVARIRLTIDSYKLDQYTFPNVIVFIAYLYERDKKTFYQIQETVFDLNEFAKKVEQTIKPLYHQGNSVYIEYIVGFVLLMYQKQYQSKFSQNETYIVKNDIDIDILSYNSTVFKGREIVNVIHGIQRGYHLSHLALSNLQRKYSLMP